MGRHSLRDAAGHEVVSHSEATPSAGRHSRELMDAPTRSFHAEALHWRADLDDTQPFEACTATQPLPLPKHRPMPPNPRNQPPLDLMRRVLNGLRQLNTDSRNPRD